MNSRTLLPFLGGALLIGFTLGCEHPDGNEFATLESPLYGYCDANVIGVGTVDVENDYLPHVIQCENGQAPLEALKAQAVAARSYLYYKLDTSGSVIDGQGDQVFSCGAQPKAIHYQAVAATAGQVIRYNNTQIAAFYVAGAYPTSNTCEANASNNDPHNTQHYVTYNWDNWGANVIQTSLGWINSGNYANRGCMSQNGSTCLANKGWGYVDILKSYYGMDFELDTATASCIDTGGSTTTGGGTTSGGGSCTPSCVGDSLMGPDCNLTQCADQGEVCQDTPTGPACVSSACSSGETTKFCSDETTLVECINGEEFTANCGAYAMYCSTAGVEQAHCVSMYCVSGPDEIPVEKEVCLDDVRYHCDEDGQLVESPCPNDAPCSTCLGCTVETCNGVDDDCDGEIDEGFDLGAFCNPGGGQCGTTGEWTCDGSGSTLCAPIEDNCDDWDPCTVDHCDPDLGCTHVSLGDVCVAGAFDPEGGSTGGDDLHGYDEEDNWYFDTAPVSADDEQGGCQHVGTAPVGSVLWILGILAAQRQRRRSRHGMG